jgi:peptidyl-prolyl cis-trans isomerase C
MRLNRPTATASVAVLACALIAQAPAPVSPAAPSTPTATTVAPQPDPVVAMINGDPIHASDLSAAAQGLPAEYRNLPPSTLFPLLLNQLIDQKALLLLARKDGLDKDPAVARQMTQASDQALQTALISRAVGPLVTEAAIHQRYDQEMAGKPAETEVHARHILVSSEDEANKIIAQIKGGADFAALAKQYSSDPGAANGGDLGWFKKTDMVPEFSAVAFALKPGQVADKPAHTQFGWHVIQTLEVRNAEPPSFEQSHDELRQQIIQEGVQKVIATAHQGLNVQKFNMDGTPQRPTDLAEPPPAPPAAAKP